MGICDGDGSGVFHYRAWAPVRPFHLRAWFRREMVVQAREAWAMTKDEGMTEWRKIEGILAKRVISEWCIEEEAKRQELRVKVNVPLARQALGFGVQRSTSNVQ